MTSYAVRHAYFYISRRHSPCYTYPQVAWLSYEIFSAASSWLLVRLTWLISPCQIWSGHVRIHCERTGQYIWLSDILILGGKKIMGWDRDRGDALGFKRIKQWKLVGEGRAWAIYLSYLIYWATPIRPIKTSSDFITDQMIDGMVICTYWCMSESVRFTYVLSRTCMVPFRLRMVY